MKKYALLSVSDKTGIVEFAKGLIELGYQIISTGGTASTLNSAGVKTINITDLTGFPECLDGRVKTLHPVVHAGLLALRDNPEHIKLLNELKINTIDVVAVNLYPFAATVQKAGVTRAEAVENIDIGGPTMLRSAAKNYRFVLSVVDPRDYSSVLNALKNKTDDENFRLNLMYKVFRHTAVYDSVISDYLCGETGEKFPEYLTVAYKRQAPLRYGENPHQSAAFYGEIIPVPSSLSGAVQLQGKELSFNNLNDVFPAILLAREFDKCAAVAVKHANPCGVALGTDSRDAYVKAHDCDPKSIYGGIVAVNRTVSAAAASEMVKTFLEVVIAPDFAPEALEVFKVKPNLRVLKLDFLQGMGLDGKHRYADFKRVEGGLLVQENDALLFDELKTVTKVLPSKSQTEEMLFAMTVVKHCKSNAIVLSNNFAAVGIGLGQTSRVWAVEEAIARAGDKAAGAVVASDAYFPFDDSVRLMAAAKVAAIIQPGGSIRDEESVKACDEAGIAMVFSGMRHFKH